MLLGSISELMIKFERTYLIVESFWKTLCTLNEYFALSPHNYLVEGYIKLQMICWKNNHLITWFYHIQLHPH